MNYNEKMEKLDKEEMYHKIIHMPQDIYSTYYETAVQGKKFADCSKIKNVFICGMGGSAISGDLIEAAFSDKFPVKVVRDYTLPFIDENTLVILCSFSGDTEETLSCLNIALEKTPFVAAISRGGKLLAKIKDDFPYIKLNVSRSPRAAIAFLFFSIIKLLEDFSMIESQKEVVDRTIGMLSCKADALCVAQENNIAKIAVAKIKGKIPLIYASNPRLNSVAYRFKCQINENSKYPAFFAQFPEMCHNEIEGYETSMFNDKIIPIFLNRFQEDNNYQKRITIFKDLIKDLEYLEYFAEGNSLIEQMFCLIYLGDVISFYLALETDVNPTSINHILYLKEKI